MRTKLLKVLNRIGQENEVGGAVGEGHHDAPDEQGLAAVMGADIFQAFTMCLAVIYISHGR